MLCGLLARITLPMTPLWYDVSRQWRHLRLTPGEEWHYTCRWRQEGTSGNIGQWDRGVTGWSREETDGVNRYTWKQTRTRSSPVWLWRRADPSRLSSARLWRSILSSSARRARRQPILWQGYWKWSSRAPSRTEASGTTGTFTPHREPGAGQTSLTHRRGLLPITHLRRIRRVYRKAVLVREDLR